MAMAQGISSGLLRWWPVPGELVGQGHELQEAQSGTWHRGWEHGSLHFLWLSCDETMCLQAQCRKSSFQGPLEVKAAQDLCLTCSADGLLDMLWSPPEGAGSPLLPTS